MQTTFSRPELKFRARSNMPGNWGVMIPVTIICAIFSILNFFVHPLSLASDILTIMMLIFIGPFSYASAYIYLRLTKGEKATLNDFFAAFSEFEKSLPLYFLMFVKIFLWSLLFIIPGIIKTLAYSQAYFLKLENPDLTASEVLALSEQMTNGYKMDIFILHLSFFGWMLLGAITHYIAYLYVTPYMDLTFAHLYHYLKAQAQQNGILPADDTYATTIEQAEQTVDEYTLTPFTSLDKQTDIAPAISDAPENDEYSKESGI